VNNSLFGRAKLRLGEIVCRNWLCRQAVAL
jgi:hypothetical protein